MVGLATVKATNTETSFTRSAPTNGSGEFRIDYLPVGNYTVEASAAGFKKYVRQNVVLTVDQTQTLGILREVGAVTQEVTVTAAAPLVNTSDAELGASTNRAR